MNKDTKFSLAMAGAIIAVGLAAVAANKLGYIDDEATVRLSVGINGLMVAAYGNRMPKAVAPDGCARRATRLGGWAFVLSGLVYAALWTFAPVKVAGVVGSAAIIAGLAATVGYAYWLRAQARAGVQ